jgi:hypothetical protein
VLARFQTLFPPMSSTTVTFPVPTPISMARERMSSGASPAENSGPNILSTNGANTANAR